MEIIIDKEDYIKEGSVFQRTAARGIIQRDGKYLLVSSKYGDCKFPGGGVHPEESVEEGLVREVREETGYTVRPESIRYYGKVQERRKGMYEDVLEMDSLYYLCETEEKAGEQDLDPYEQDYEYRPVWVSLQEAIKNNRKEETLKECPWAHRERRVMEYMAGLGAAPDGL